MQTGTFVPEKSNIWRDCVAGMYAWVKEHLEEVGQQLHTGALTISSLSLKLIVC